MQFIDLKQQYKLIKDDVLNEINQVLDSGQYILGEKVKLLEDELSKFVGVKHTIGVADGTKALLIALMALEVKPGDEIIVPDFTFFATASMAALLGAVPVFVDVDPKTYNLDPNLIEAAITKKTKAIIPVGLFGQCADMDSINAIATKHGIAVIEDAAQSLGAKYKGRASGSLATIACTSFFPSKPLGCYGDAGACFTNDDYLAEKIRQIRIHGQDARYHHVQLGVNGRIDTLQAGILLAKLRVFDKEVELREKIGKRYSSLLKDTNCVVPYVAPHNLHVYAQYTILLENREAVAKALNQAGIPTAVHYPVPLHMQPAFKGYYKGGDFVHAKKAANGVLSLPMHPYLDEDTQDLIVNKVKSLI